MIRFALNAFLARLIAPDVFGSFALAFVYAELLSIPMAFGFGNAIVQLPEGPSETVPAALQLNVLVAAFVLIGSAIAFPISLRADGYHVAKLVVPLCATRALVVISGTYDGFLQRELAFSKLAAIRVIGVVLSSGGALLLALLNQPYAALVAREALVTVVPSFYLIMRMDFDWKSVFWPSQAIKDVRRKVLTLGKSLLLVQALDILYNRLDQVLLARFIGAADLAYYYQSRYIAGLPLAAVAPATQTVALRVFVAVADEPDKVRRATEMLQIAVTHVLVLCAIPLAFAPLPLITLAYGPRWAPVAQILPALAAWVVVQPLSQNSQMLLMALGKWNVIRGAKIVQLVLLAVAVPPLVWLLGSQGAALALAVSALGSMAWMRRGVTAAQRPGFVAYRGMVAGITASTLLWVLTRSLTLGGWFEVALACGAGVLYLATALAVDPKRNRDVAEYIYLQLRSRSASSSS